MNFSFRKAITIAFWASLTRAAPLAHVKNGTYEGFYIDSFHQDLFLGIPYAQDAGGWNRFRIPQSLNETWAGTRAAQTYSHACPDSTPEADALYGMSENCLSINIVRPAGTDASDAVPIMFWIHGGSYQVGTSGLPRYNLSYIVQESVQIGKPIIGVSINYRKGGWGNMYSIEIQGSGNTNIALRDMRKALAWVSENISGFGGDPNSVTIWGESSGSFAVGQLLLMYGGRTDNLFHRSIQESGSATTAWYNGSDWYQPIYNKIVSQVNCDLAIDTLDCLRSVPYSTLYPYMNSSLITGPGWYPTVDGDIIPAYPSQLLSTGQFAHHIPHILGTNTDEGTDNAPLNLINTTSDLYNYLLTSTGFNFPPSTISTILNLYPNNHPNNTPNTSTNTNPPLSAQYARVASILGDIFYHAPRLSDSYHYSLHNPNSTYTYRFNTRGYVPRPSTRNTPNTSTTTTIPSVKNTSFLTPLYKGVSHATELSFVFNNPFYIGPWPEYIALGKMMSRMWIRFAYSGDPNDPEEATPIWLPYNTAKPINQKGLYISADTKAIHFPATGRNLLFQTTSQGGSHMEADDWRLAGREYLTRWSRRRHV